MSKFTVTAIMLIIISFLGCMVYTDYQSEQTIRDCFRNGGTWNTKPILAVDHHCATQSPKEKREE